MTEQQEHTSGKHDSSVVGVWCKIEKNADGPTDTLSQRFGRDYFLSGNGKGFRLVSVPFYLMSV